VIPDNTSFLLVDEGEVNDVLDGVFWLSGGALKRSLTRPEKYQWRREGENETGVMRRESSVRNGLKTRGFW